MSQPKDGIKSKVELLKLAQSLGSVSKACKAMGFSRDSFYRFRDLYEIGGAQALASISRRKPNLKNRANPAIEKAVVAYALAHPACGQVRVAEALKQRALNVSPAGVRTIWLRHDLQTFQQRVAALAVQARQPGAKLTAEQSKALARLRTDPAMGAGLQPTHPGSLGVQAAIALGEVKGLGRLHLQVFMDSYSQVALAKLHEVRGAQAAADLLKDRVLPFFKGFGVPLQRMLTDRSSDYRGQGAESPYVALLAANGIEHLRAGQGAESALGACEVFFRTASSEFFATALRARQFASVAQLQGELEGWLERYNAERPCPGRHCYGKTPLETFIEHAQLPATA